jgi:hypothetical protein
MADRLDRAIAQKKRHILNLQGQVQREEEALRVLLDAAKEQPDTTSGVDPPSSPKPKGRKKGSIAHKWRRTFESMIHSGHANSIEEIHRFANRVGIKITEKSAGTRARDYAKAGLLEKRPEGYWVPEETIRRLALK